VAEIEDEWERVKRECTPLNVSLRVQVSRLSGFAATSLSEFDPKVTPLRKPIGTCSTTEAARICSASSCVSRQDKELSAEEALRLEAYLEHRRKLAAVAKTHPRGHLIGATQVMQFKSTRSNVTWGTRRKQKA
jgi:hypothetical protein